MLARLDDDGRRRSCPARSRQCSAHWWPGPCPHTERAVQGVGKCHRNCGDCFITLWYLQCLLLYMWPLENHSPCKDMEYLTPHVTHLSGFATQCIVVIQCVGRGHTVRKHSVHSLRLQLSITEKAAVNICTGNSLIYCYSSTSTTHCHKQTSGGLAVSEFQGFHFATLYVRNSIMAIM